MTESGHFVMKDSEQSDHTKNSEETDNVSLSRHHQAQDAEILPYRDPALVEKFLEKPLPEIAAIVTGALSLGRSDAVLAGGRLIQAALKGKLLQQASREIEQLIEKGKIKADYAATKHGFKSLVELLEFIDSEVPDEDRLKAVMAMFTAVGLSGQGNSRPAHLQ